MAIRIATTTIKIVATGASAVGRALAGIRTTLTGIARAPFALAASGLGAMRAAAVGLGTAIGNVAKLLGPILAVISILKLIKIGRDAEESANRFNVLFGDILEKAERTANAIAEGFGRSETQIKNALGTFQAFFKGLNVGSKEALDLSQTVTRLSLDFASFFDISDDEALGKFISGLSGSGEVFDRYGINIKEAALQQELIALGMKEGAKSATEQQKALGRLSIIAKTLGKQGVVGDVQRTFDSLGNTSKRVGARLAELGAKIGQALIPFAIKVLEAFELLIPVLAEVARLMGNIAKTILTAFGAMLGLGNVSATVGETISEVVATLANLFTSIKERILRVTATILDALAKITSFFSEKQANLFRFQAEDLRNQADDLNAQAKREAQEAIDRFNALRAKLGQKPELGSLADIADIFKNLKKAVNEEGGTAGKIISPEAAFRDVQQQLGKNGTLEQLLAAEAAQRAKEANEQAKRDAEAQRAREEQIAFLRTLTQQQRVAVFNP